MTKWNFNPSEYTEITFAPIPEGNRKVTIANVEEKIFNSGKEGFEITFDVDGFNSKLWYYLVFDPHDVAKTNQRIGMFFDSFAIQDHDFSHYGNWIGKDGAVRVKHDMYNGSVTAKVAFCLSRSQQSTLFPQHANPFAAKLPTTNATPERNFNGFSF